MAKRPEQRNEPPVAPVFDVCIHGQPVSAQTKRRRALDVRKGKVSWESAAAWPPGQPSLDGRVRLRVTHYYEIFAGDMDNIRKVIQDVLQGIAYHNDRQVSDGHDRRLNINGSFHARHMSPRLAMAFSDGRPFIHIEVWSNPDQEVIL